MTNDETDRARRSDTLSESSFGNSSHYNPLSPLYGAEKGQIGEAAVCEKEISNIVYLNSGVNPLDSHDVLSLLCRLSRKWGMYVHIFEPREADLPPDENSLWDHVMKAAPYLSAPAYHQIVGDGIGWILFDTEAEMETYYRNTCGDDGGDTMDVPYNGPARVYALTCGPDGEFWNENT